MPEHFYLRFRTSWDLSELDSPFEHACFDPQGFFASSLGLDRCIFGCRFEGEVMVDLYLAEHTLYLWRSSEEEVADDLHLVVLADQDGAYVVLVT